MKHPTRPCLQLVVVEQEQRCLAIWTPIEDALGKTGVVPGSHLVADPTGVDDIENRGFALLVGPQATSGLESSGATTAGWTCTTLPSTR